MILETIQALQVLAEIIGYILIVLQPIVMPIGEVMVFAVNFLLDYFPPDVLILYIIIFVVFVVAGIIVNTSPIGDKLKNKFNKFDEKHFKKYTKHIPDDAEDAFKTMEQKKKENAEKVKVKPEKMTSATKDDLDDKEE